MLFIVATLWVCPAWAADGPTGAVRVEVGHDGAPVAGATVRAGSREGVTNTSGVVQLEVPGGSTAVEVTHPDFDRQIAEIVVRAGVETRVTVELGHLELEDEVIVTATRSGKRLQDQPVRVEVIEREEIEEKILMAPGDISMLLNETSGLRVQVSAPSLGAASVRVQGLRGRYTQLLADGLPLYGGQTGAIGLLQIPPMDLAQVEIIKGVSSAFYGASALGGVINLVSRRPPNEESERELLANRTTRGGTDGILWLTHRLSPRWGLTLLGGGHDQRRQDVDADGWADMPRYTRGVVRPRLFWDDEKGRSLLLTAGAMVEDRVGGATGAPILPAVGPFEEALDTRRFDGGLVARLPFGATRLLSLRASGMTQRHDHTFGDGLERDRHGTSLVEASLMTARPKHTWVVGAVLQSDTYRGRDARGFDYTDAVPGVFLQDDFVLSASTTISASARLDHHDAHGVFVNPRVSALVRQGRWTVRASGGSGHHVATPFTEETETVGLSRLEPLRDLEPERARSASLDVSWTRERLDLHATAFASIVDDPIGVRELDGDRLLLVNAPGPTRTIGGELLGRLRWRDFVVTATYTLTRSTEADLDAGTRGEVPLTPQHAAGLVAVWEQHGKSRVGFEMYYTGSQRLDDNPYRSRSEAHWVLGAMAERRVGPVRVFLNAENFTDTRQTKHDPLVRPQRAKDGRWTVDAWAPLEGRTINGGVRLSF